MASTQDVAATKRIVADKTDDNPAGYVVINAADFDPKAQKEYTGPDYDPNAAPVAPEAPAQ